MTITQHAHLYNFHTSNLIFEEIFVLNFLSMQPLIVASTAAVHGLIATVVVSTTTVVATATLAPMTTVAAALFSTAASATWAPLVVDDTRGGLAIAEGLAEHLKLPLDRRDVGRVGSE